MVFFNYSTMQMAAKIVYYGPGLCGKTTNLQYIYDHTTNDSRGEMVSLETETDRTLFFDLLPIDVGSIGGFKTQIQLYTVPGQVFYNTTRKLVLKGVDGVVFVADSQRPMLDANVDSLVNLEDNLAEIGFRITELPVVIQYNKRDLPDVASMAQLEALAQQARAAQLRGLRALRPGRVRDPDRNRQAHAGVAARPADRRPDLDATLGAGHRATVRAPRPLRRPCRRRAARPRATSPPARVRCRWPRRRAQPSAARAAGRRPAPPPPSSPRSKSRRPRPTDMSR